MAAGINVILAVSLNVVNGFTGQFSIGHAGFMAVGAYTAAKITMAFRDVPVLGLSAGASDAGRLPLRAAGRDGDRGRRRAARRACPRCGCAAITSPS